MKNTKKSIIAVAALAIAVLPTFTGCISVKREAEPTTTSSTTTTSVRPSVLSPSTTTVERTTTY